MYKKKSLKLQLFQLLLPLCIILYLHYSHLHPHLTIKSLFHQLHNFFFLFFFKNQPVLVLVLWVPIFLRHQDPSFHSDSHYRSFSRPCFWFLGHLQPAAYADLCIQPASPRACSTLPKCWLSRDRRPPLRFGICPGLVWKRSYRNDSPEAPQLRGGHPPRARWSWRRSAQVIVGARRRPGRVGCSVSTEPGPAKALRVWAHSEAAGSSHVSTTGRKKLCRAYATLQSFVTCPSFRQRSKVASLTQNPFP